jgi:hypothetical protein
MPKPGSATDGLRAALLKSSVRRSCCRLVLAAALRVLGTERVPLDGEAGDEGGESVMVEVRAVEVRELRGVAIRGFKCCCGDCNVDLDASLLDRRGEYGSKLSNFGPCRGVGGVRMRPAGGGVAAIVSFSLSERLTCSFRVVSALNGTEWTGLGAAGVSNASPTAMKRVMDGCI